MRLSTTSSLLSGRRDVIVIASVSCLYGIGNPVEFQKNVITLQKDQIISRTKLLHQLVQSLYARTESDFNHGNFRIKGDTVDIFPVSAELPVRLEWFDDELEKLREFDPATQRSLDKVEQLVLTPTSFNPIIAKQIQRNQQDISSYLSPEEIELLNIGNYP